jgi:S1-C subfamily serine protease
MTTGTATANCIRIGLTAFLFGVMFISTSLTAGEKEQIEIEEFGAVIVSSHDGPRVAEITPVSGRLDKYRSVDLQSGDLVMAVNGQRIESIAALRELLDSLVAGDEVKMALQRFKSLKMARYEVGTEAERLAAKELTDNYVEIQTEPGAVVMKKGGPVMMKMKFESADGAVPCIGLAAMLDDSDGQIRVAEIIDLPPQLAPPIELAAGDILTELQGQTFSTTAEFIDQFDKLKAGDQVTLTLIRNDSETKLTFEMPKQSGHGVKVIKR